MIITDLSNCEHGKTKALCKDCNPPEIVTGVMTVDTGCRWFGKAVLHGKPKCGCQFIPDDYVQFTSEGVPWTRYLVGMVRDVKFDQKKRPGKKIAAVVPVAQLLIQCRECWAAGNTTRGRFRSEIGAVDHLKSYHGIDETTRITEVMRDITK